MSRVYKRTASAPSAVMSRVKTGQSRVLVVRTPSGLSGDMLLAGLSRLAGVRPSELDDMVGEIGLPDLQGCIKVVPHQVNQISGWRSEIVLPHEHAHRTLQAIVDIIDSSRLSGSAKSLARKAFTILAEAESRVHGIAAQEVAFHEVGALDSILDTCLSAALFARLAPDSFFCSPLPLCDGMVKCEHGLLATPAPAVQEMLVGVPVYGIASAGETVTPTALAFLLAADAQFGKWPAIRIEATARAYGGRILRGVPNGAIFALGAGD